MTGITLSRDLLIGMLSEAAATAAESVPDDQLPGFLVGFQAGQDGGQGHRPILTSRCDARMS